MINAPLGRDRCIIYGKYLIDKKTTVRGVAAHFGMSKSTVHKDITQTLKKENYGLYLEVKEILDLNKQERHLRGGEATRQKYKSIQSLRG